MARTQAAWGLTRGGRWGSNSRLHSWGCAEEKRGVDGTQKQRGHQPTSQHSENLTSAPGHEGLEITGCRGLGNHGLQGAASCSAGLVNERGAGGGRGRS